jgi:hypothetical protein
MNLESKVGTHGRAIVSILATIRQMTERADKKARAIGFRAKAESRDNNPSKQYARGAERNSHPIARLETRLTSDV